MACKHSPAQQRAESRGFRQDRGRIRLGWFGTASRGASRNRPSRTGATSTGLRLINAKTMQHPICIYTVDIERWQVGEQINVRLFLRLQQGVQDLLTQEEVDANRSLRTGCRRSNNSPGTSRNVQLIPPPPRRAAAPGTMRHNSRIRGVAVGRRSLRVADVVEVLEHWAAGRPLRAIAESLWLDRHTVRKYITPAREAGYGPSTGPPAEGWALFVAEVCPELGKARKNGAAWDELAARHDEIVERSSRRTPHGAPRRGAERLPCPRSNRSRSRRARQPASSASELVRELHPERGVPWPHPRRDHA